MTTEIIATELEVVVGAYPLRLTECPGSGPLGNGTRLLVAPALAQALCERHPSHLRVVGQVRVSSLANGVWQAATAPRDQAPAPSPVATAAAPATSRPKVAGNKTMAGKPAAEAKT